MSAESIKVIGPKEAVKEDIWVFEVEWGVGAERGRADVTVRLYARLIKYISFRVYQIFISSSSAKQQLPIYKSRFLHLYT